MELPPGEVHVYRARLNGAPDTIAELASALPPDERRRLGRDAEGTEELASRALVRLLLARYLKLDPAGIPLDPGAAPAGVKGGTRLRFDRARSGRLLVCAVCRGPAVGVDVERVRRLDDLERDGDPFAVDSLSVVERETLRGLPRGLRAEGFSQCRTRKQALLRAADGELPCSLRDLDVSVTPGVPPRIYRWRRTDGTPDDWTLLHLRPGPRHVGAVAVPNRVSGLRLWSWPGAGSGEISDGDRR